MGTKWVKTLGTVLIKTSKKSLFQPEELYHFLTVFREMSR